MSELSFTQPARAPVHNKSEQVATQSPATAAAAHLARLLLEAVARLLSVPDRSWQRKFSSNSAKI